ncbi:MAG: hypothetical protein JNL65_00295 [Saprospiraceae bacterium]|nr:hypothetical protein [Saprospiraceae bacterium]HRG67508.1 hypothetical protein [Saprospiraceae bacterium]
MNANESDYDLSFELHLLFIVTVLDAFRDQTNITGKSYTDHLDKMALHEALGYNSVDQASTILHDLLEDCSEWTAD